MFIREELEDLLGVISNNEDFTGMLFDALKSTTHKRDLLKYKKLCVDNELERRLGLIADRHSTAGTASKKTDIRSSFEAFLGTGRP